MKLFLMECGLWGFTQQGQETPPGAYASATVRNAFPLQSDLINSMIALNVENLSSVTDLFSTHLFSNRSARSMENFTEAIQICFSHIHCPAKP